MNHNYDAKSRYFQYREGRLFVENVSVEALAAEYGSPTYVYSQNDILDAFNGYKKGLEGIPHLIAFAIKANGNLAILKRLAEEGAGADLTSGGELMLSLKAGIPAGRMIYSGVGKTDDEIKRALDAGILMFNVESEPELQRLAYLADQSGKVAPIAIRVNPNIDANTHPKISTGLNKHKFGVPVEAAYDLYQKAAGMKALKVIGIAAHIGSSLMDTKPLLDSLNLLMDFRSNLQDQGIEIPYLDMGGGLGIQYESDAPETPSDYAHKLKERIKDAGITLIIEPGRSMVGNAGLLLCRVTYVKKNDERTFVIVDAGMNSLARPAIYGAFHDIVPENVKNGEAKKVDVVGPICESSDVFGREMPLPECETGDILAICSAGAYGFSMSSNYNGQLKPAEVMVDGDNHRLVRQRETYDDLFRGQVE